MNCQRFEDVVGDLGRDQIMEADVRVAALNHSDDCSSCNQRLRDEQALTHGLNLVSQQMASVGAPAEIETRLREAMRQTRIGPVVPMVRKTRRPYWIAVAAAIVLFVGAIVAINWQKPRQANQEVAGPPPAVEEKSPKVEQPSENSAVAVKNEKASEAVKPTVRRPRSARRVQADTRVVANHAQEIATEFIPLGNINGASLQDGGYIVRVELPRSALVKFGLPVNMDRLNENVKADVWLGVDGLAHAIRFVQ